MVLLFLVTVLLDVANRRWNNCLASAYSFLEGAVLKLLLFCVLFVLCWPLALIALVLYPVVWLLLLPFRVVGIAVEGVLELISALFTLPVRLIRAI
ncbi:hypothetical protein SAMN05443244_2522 [Terriglobus roseus]|uniref:Uncharacterized protein n=1 Tax=Terriglobus roseus TaxID=392734 RepID=A0A1H4PD96_9BACT|nr:hypothetical protein SAMN05443244_2522 [Terriglobus roseus]